MDISENMCVWNRINNSKNTYGIHIKMLLDGKTFSDYDLLRLFVCVVHMGLLYLIVYDI